MKVSCTARAWSWLSCGQRLHHLWKLVGGTFRRRVGLVLGSLECVGLWTLEQGPECVGQLPRQIVWRHLEVRHGAPSERPSSPSMGTDLPLLLISSNMRSRKESDSCIEVQNQ